MSSYHKILEKLGQFYRKYYTRMLIKGALLFLAFGLLFFLLIVGVEYSLWLGSAGRLALLVFGLAVEVFLLYRYILTPAFYLFRVRNGISNKQASLLIGRHFPEVQDKLYNLLDLADNPEQSELLMASIDRRSGQFAPVPFTRAINYRESLKYAKYLLIPGTIIALIALAGILKPFFSSYERVVRYSQVYERPAPFSFHVITGSLDILENKEHTVSVFTEGEVAPEKVYAVINGNPILLSKNEDRYSYTFTPPLQDTDFYFTANGVDSKRYELNALKTPAIQNFSLELTYPAYTGKRNETLNGTGNATIPEGTQARWGIRGIHTEDIVLNARDTTIQFNKEGDAFNLSQRIFRRFSYEITTSNENVSDFERLRYEFKVIPDTYPDLVVRQVVDSLTPNLAYFSGEATDDYKLKSIRAVCVSSEEGAQEKRVVLHEPDSGFKEFYYTFPSGFELEPGMDYSVYFEAVDNDGIRGGKTTKSQVFDLRILGSEELEERRLENRQSLLEEMDRSVDVMERQKEDLQEINKSQKEKKSLNFNDQKTIKEFLSKQQLQEEMMEKFSRELKENLGEDQRTDEEKKLLQERLERQEREAEKNARLMEELKKLAERIDKEDLEKRLEELAKQQQSNQRNLEQLLELTKRYYVTEKTAQIARKLEKLGKQQEELGDKEIDEQLQNPEQEGLNESFEKITRELRELEKENEKLKKPLNIPTDRDQEEAIKQQQKEATDGLKEEKSKEGDAGEQDNKEMQENISEKQKKAGKKMQEMGESLEQAGASMGGDSGIAEDAEMLRQILDNLVTFSFKQEALYDAMEASDFDLGNFSKNVRTQRDLRAMFEHVDDSLFALSLRRVELSEFVNEQITDVYYNIDKSLENMADRRMYQGSAYQQSVINASNTLADYLANLLDNMQQSLASGSGSGSGQAGFQLPDIIKSQGELKDKMGSMGGKGESGEEGQEQDGQEGSENGEQESSGEEGGSGNEGKSTEQGEGQGEEGTGGTEPSEQEMKELFEIYKEQQRLREALEEQLKDMINTEDKKLGERLVRLMEDFENDLLENGITKRTRDKMNLIEHQLLKLENASLQQGEKKERESQTNLEQYKNPITTKPEALENFQKETERLNRQALPLQESFRTRVQRYFKDND